MFIFLIADCGTSVLVTERVESELSGLTCCTQFFRKSSVLDAGVDNLLKQMRQVHSADQSPHHFILELWKWLQSVVETLLSQPVTIGNVEDIRQQFDFCQVSFCFLPTYCSHPSSLDFGVVRYFVFCYMCQFNLHQFNFLKAMIRLSQH